MSTRGSKGSRSAYWGSENKPAPTPTPAPTPVANAVEATPEPVQPKQAEVLKTEVQNAMQTVINTIVAAEEKQKTAGTTATKDVTDALTAAQNKAKEIGDKYGVDISKLVNEATRAVESGNADASARLEKALTSKQTDIDNIVRDITTRTSTTAALRRTEDEAAIKKMEKETFDLSKAQKDVYGAAETEQRGRADYQMQQQQAMVKNLQTERAGIGQEAYMSELEKAAKGQMPSAAELMLKSNLAENQKRMAATASARGYNPAAQRAAIMAGQNAALTATGQAASMRADEMATARSQWTQAYQTRLGQLQQADQFAAQMGLQIEDLYTKATGIKLAGAQIEKDLQANAIAAKLGLRTQAASDIMNMRAQSASQIAGLQSESASSALAQRAGLNQQRLANTQNIALQGLAARGQAAQYGADLRAQTAMQQAAGQSNVASQILGQTGAAAQQGAALQAGQAQAGMGTAADYWKQVSTQAQQTQLQQNQLQQDQYNADRDFYAKIAATLFGAGGQVGSSMIKAGSAAAGAPV